jgi:phage gp46-like protein
MTAVARRKVNALGQYESNGSGGLLSDEGVSSRAAMALRHERGSSPAFPFFGSRFHTIQKITPAATRLAEAFAIEALQHLIDQRFIKMLRARSWIDARVLYVEASYKTVNGTPQSVRTERRF